MKKVLLLLSVLIQTVANLSAFEGAAAKIAYQERKRAGDGSTSGAEKWRKYIQQTEVITNGNYISENGIVSGLPQDQLLETQSVLLLRDLNDPANPMLDKALLNGDDFNNGLLKLLSHMPPQMEIRLRSEARAKPPYIAQRNAFLIPTDDLKAHIPQEYNEGEYRGTLYATLRSGAVSFTALASLSAYNMLIQKNKFSDALPGLKYIVYATTASCASSMLYVLFKTYKEKQYIKDARTMRIDNNNQAWQEGLRTELARIERFARGAHVRGPHHERNVRYAEQIRTMVAQEAIRNSGPEGYSYWRGFLFGGSIGSALGAGILAAATTGISWLAQRFMAR